MSSKGDSKEKDKGEAGPPPRKKGTSSLKDVQKQQLEKLMEDPVCCALFLVLKEFIYPRVNCI